MTVGFCGAFGCDGFFAPAKPNHDAYLSNMLIQSQSLLQRGDVIVDINVDLYYDALEYGEEAADGTSIDVGKSPIPIKGGLHREFKRPTTLIEDQPPHPPYTKEFPPPLPPNHPEGDIHRSFDPPPPPNELPLRFLRAGKDDPIEGRRRYEQTLAWRKEYGMDTIIKSPHQFFELIKQHYPQYFHLRGRNNEPVWYEKPPAVNLKALMSSGVDLDGLLRHYAMVTEFGWQYLEPDDMARSITVIDLEGIKMTDFVGDVVDFTKKCSAFTGQHYPERAGYVFVINVPYWFNMIWTVVKNFVDPVTLEKISIVRGENAIKEALLKRIPIENIPPEYGGTSMPLGLSPEEQKLKAFMIHNLMVANGTSDCGGIKGNCPFCSWVPSRSY
jgi:CRAL/TRIO domain